METNMKNKGINDICPNLICKLSINDYFFSKIVELNAINLFFYIFVSKICSISKNFFEFVFVFTSSNNYVLNESKVNLIENEKLNLVFNFENFIKILFMVFSFFLIVIIILNLSFDLEIKNFYKSKKIYFKIIDYLKI
jgi:hypothetical protein